MLRKLMLPLKEVNTSLFIRRQYTVYNFIIKVCLITINISLHNKPRFRSEDLRFIWPQITVVVPYITILAGQYTF
jgi:hypothetical protein